MLERIIIAGAGGQGIMLLGKVLAQGAMRESKYVTWLPAYGAEVRGGTSHCMVIISDTEIGSPYIDKADSLIIMNAPSWERFKKRAKNRGLFLINSSLVIQDIDKQNAFILRHPFTELAINLGEIKVANMIAIGCYLARNKVIELKTIVKVIEDFATREKKDLVEINKKALFLGRELVDKLAKQGEA